MTRNQIIAVIGCLFVISGCINSSNYDKTKKQNNIIKGNIEFKSIKTDNWQKKTMTDYFVLIPPGYSFNYKYADDKSAPDTASGTISNGIITISISRGYCDLDTSANPDQNLIEMDIEDSSITKVCTFSTLEGHKKLGGAYWDLASPGLFKNSYNGVQMDIANWEENQIDTIVAIFKSVGKSKK